MFRAAPMLKVELLCLASEAQEVALLLARHGDFGPAVADDRIGEQAGTRYRELYLEATSRLEKIMGYFGRDSVAALPADAIAPNERELAGINNRLLAIWQTCSAASEREVRAEEDLARLTMLRETYVRLAALDVDPARLLRRDGLLDTRIGQLPTANVKRLGEALSVAGYLLTVFDRSGDQAFVVVAGPAEDKGAHRLGGLLDQAGWRDLPVPPELRTDPAAAAGFLEREGERLEAMDAEHAALRDGHWQQHGAWLGQAGLLLALARPLAESSLLGYSDKGQLAVFAGWVPRRSHEHLQEVLDARFGGRYLLKAREPGPEDAGKVPTLVSYPAWLSPFAGLVRNYGVPRYGEFDPALLFALSYVLLFGAMFGDVGHGAVLLVVALLLRGRLARLRWVGVAAALASVGFGVMYGSVFGYEGLIDPVWRSPLRDPVRVLWLAVAAGTGFISLTLLLNVYNRLVARQWLQGLLGGGGLAGLVFYLAALDGIRGLLAGVGFGLANGVLTTGALLMVALGIALETAGSPGERLVVAVVEGLETAVKLFANTLSFLRVAAFSLNHVALALAVFAIAGELNAVGQGIALVLGNVVIIVLEGGIVAIQALRLMYYEGLSRFFAGDGVEFRPLRLAAGKK